MAILAVWIFHSYEPGSRIDSVELQNEDPRQHLQRHLQLAIAPPNRQRISHRACHLHLQAPSPLQSLFPIAIALAIAVASASLAPRLSPSLLTRSSGCFQRRQRRQAWAQRPEALLIAQLIESAKFPAFSCLSNNHFQRVVPPRCAIHHKNPVNDFKPAAMIRHCADVSACKNQVFWPPNHSSNQGISSPGSKQREYRRILELPGHNHRREQASLHKIRVFLAKIRLTSSLLEDLAVQPSARSSGRSAACPLEEISPFRSVAAFPHTRVPSPVVRCRVGTSIYRQTRVPTPQKARTRAALGPRIKPCAPAYVWPHSPTLGCVWLHFPTFQTLSCTSDVCCPFSCVSDACRAQRRSFLQFPHANSPPNSTKKSSRHAAAVARRRRCWPPPHASEGPQARHIARDCFSRYHASQRRPHARDRRSPTPGTGVRRC